MQFAYQLYSQVLSEDEAEDSAGPSLPIIQRGFNIELNWMPRLNQFNQLRARGLGNAFNLEVLIKLSWLKNIKAFNII